MVSLKVIAALAPFLSLTLASTCSKNSTSSTTMSSVVIPAVSSSSSASALPASTSSSSSVSPSDTSVAISSASTLVATFTEYGSGDANGSPNCLTTTNACGNPALYNGYTAALSQLQFGVGPGQGAGPACGTCYEITITEDLNGNPVTEKSIKVTVDNLCPIDGNTICNVPNSYGGDIHFDLCIDTGAPEAFFTSTGAGKGTAVEISC